MERDLDPTTRKGKVEEKKKILWSQKLYFLNELQKNDKRMFLGIANKLYLRINDIFLQRMVKGKAGSVQMILLSKHFCLPDDSDDDAPLHHICIHFSRHCQEKQI
jgi:hypothetical protein